MLIYLPIAEISVDIFLLLMLGGGVGFLSGLFGVGGGFLMTPHSPAPTNPPCLLASCHSAPNLHLHAKILSATRSAFAAMVRAGLVPPLDGKNDASTTYKLSMP